MLSALSRWYRPSAKHRDIVTGARFEDVMRALTECVVRCCSSCTRPTSCRSAPVRCRRGSFARGYFNLHGASPIGGHIRADNCAHIAFVIRRFAGRPSCSLQFLNATGEAMFKVFVRSDNERNLIAEASAALRDLASTASQRQDEIERPVAKLSHSFVPSR